MGLFDTLGSMAGFALGGPLGGMIGQGVGGALGAGSNGPANQGYNSAARLFSNLINQTSGAVDNYQNQAANLGQGYSESPGLKASEMLLKNKLASMGENTSPTSFSANYAPLVAADYNNFFNRQYATMGAQTPLMNMNLAGTNALAGNAINQGMFQQGTNVANMYGGADQYGSALSNLFSGLFSGNKTPNANGNLNVGAPGQGSSGFFPNYTPNYKG